MSALDRDQDFLRMPRLASASRRIPCVPVWPGAAGRAASAEARHRRGTGDQGRRLATDCRIARFHVFARRTIFYPGPTKGYQISQYDGTVSEARYVDIEVAVERQALGVTPSTWEDDAGRACTEAQGFRPRVLRDSEPQRARPDRDRQRAGQCQLRRSIPLTWPRSSSQRSRSRAAIWKGCERKYRCG